MIEIIPNWHPIFVHFTVALLSAAAGFFFLAAVFPRHKWQGQWLNVAFWNLWGGAGITVLTVAAGWYAFNTVTHDTPSHAAMIDHRNWALVTAFVAISMAAWSLRIYARGRPVTAAFLGGMVLVAGLLLSTAWHGAELVYRHGLGVMSLPEPETGADGHAHSHGNGPAEGEQPDMSDMPAGSPRENPAGALHDEDRAEGHDESHDDGHEH